ncbi:steroid 17-alpha-hydroxylase/17,20 lyase-like [Asterias rubens]|uniref:steroid 17-alpha-hydroxylase/17,20 lyase-like n=1 Tax=Asterias rubens TaxID=7604 RepID=UPI001455D6CF|nr:steroid 17-alpha-hydroxylase/17,20 lyase-like [Asterias rubens]XP_033639202.1 steroid 17-alpha-hydroxylase/17,20 lyase-like [Asterias rubens]
MILTASLCGTALCAMYYLKEQYDYTIRRMPPGPSSIPFIGNALSIDCNAPHLSMLELAKKYGNIFSIKLGSQRVVILNSCEVIKEAYKGLDISHRPNIYCMDVLVGDKGFLTCKDTNQWRLHTKLCRSALRVINNSSLGIKISEEADCLINKMLDYHGKAFNPCQDLYLASLNILCNISFGERYSHNDPELHEILDYSAQILKVISPVHPVNALPWLRHFPNKWFDSLLKAKDKRDRLLMRKYVQHVATYKDGEVRDMLDAMLASAKQAVQEKDENSLSVLTPEHIIINMWLMFFAGTDTVANTLQWGLLYMAAFPKKQAKVQDQIDEVLGKDGPLTLESKSSLPYLEATVYEIMRFSSLTILGVPHAAAVDTRVGGYYIPKGTQVMANFWAVHHDEAIWDRPHDFLPERFLDTEGKLRNMSEFPFFMPFSTGQRSCIGKGMAKSELFLILGKLLQRFCFQLPLNAKVDLQGMASVSLIPKPYEIKALERAMYI